jgi:hypothetical protein
MVNYRTRGTILPAVRLGLEAVLNIDGAEITNVKDLTVAIQSALKKPRPTQVHVLCNDGWYATLGTLKDASIEFTVLDK